jgi:ABC-type antimicrobial peptide transport system permease subunit
MSEANFLRIFPQTAGYQLFLFRPAPSASSPPEAVGEITTLLESTLSDYGLDVVDTQQRLAGFLAIQNTYLSTFQMLGALGLLLGTAGLAVVELRSVLERRGEMALMRASGFGVNRLVWLVLLENLLLLGAGLAIGSVAALVSLLPHLAPQGAGVPWRTICWLLGLITAVGVAAAWLATRRALATPLVPALRGE